MRNGVLYATLVGSLTHWVVGDLPSHCTREDSAGKWRLYFLKGPVPDWRTNTGGNFCGYTAINSNRENLERGQRIEQLMHRSDPSSEDFKELLGMSADGDVVEVELSLTQAIEDVYGEANAHHLMILDPSDQSKRLGYWTMGFDEFVVLNDFHLTPSAVARKVDLFVRYRCTGETECGKDDDAESPDGTTNGYVSYCGQTLVGLWSAVDGSKQGCVWARKSDMNEANKIHSLAVPHNEQHAGGRPIKILSPEFTNLETSRRVGEVFSHTSGVMEAGSQWPFLTSSGRTNRYKVYETGQFSDEVSYPITAGTIDRVKGYQSEVHSRPLDLCHTEADFEADSILSTLPEGVRESYDFRDRYGSYGSRVKNQGPCGGCYAMGIADAVQGAIYKDFTDIGIPIPEDFELSPQGILSCSYTAQACNGGFPGSVGFDLLVTGITTEQCMPYTFDNGKCKAECFSDEREVWYVKEGTYKGGFYGRCSMARIMQHIYRHGPMQIAIEAPNGLNPTRFETIVSEDVHHIEPEHSTADLIEISIRNAPKKFLDILNHVHLNDDQSVSLSEENAHLLRHLFVAPGKQPERDGDVHLRVHASVEPNKDALERSLSSLLSQFGSHFKVDHIEAIGSESWGYTNHALLLVGWGAEVDPKTGKEVKYWIAKNSWGPNWGPFGDGHLKLQRGINLGGVEAQAMSFLPDPCRGAYRWFRYVQRQVRMYRWNRLTSNMLLTGSRSEAGSSMALVICGAGIGGFSLASHAVTSPHDHGSSCGWFGSKSNKMDEVADERDVLSDIDSHKAYTTGSGGGCNIVAKMGDGGSSATEADSTPSTKSGEDEAMWGELMDGVEAPADGRIRPTELHLAAFRGDIIEAKTIIDNKGHEANQADSEGMTPLMVAVKQGHMDVAELLLGVSDVKATDKEEWTVLHWACEVGRLPLVKRLCEEHSELMTMKDKRGLTPLHIACWQGNVELAKILLDHKADMNALTKWGETPLHHAAFFGHVEVCRLLLERGADPLVKDRLRRSPKSLASGKGVGAELRDLFREAMTVGLAIGVCVALQVVVPALFVTSQPAVAQSAAIATGYARRSASNLRAGYNAGSTRATGGYQPSWLLMGIGAAAILATVVVARKGSKRGTVSRRAAYDKANAVVEASTPLPRNPAVRVGRLSNGLEYVIQDHEDAIERRGGVHATLEVHVGSRDEGPREQGIAHLVEHAAFMGCDRRRADFASKGGQSNAETDYHHVSFETVIPGLDGLKGALGLLRQAGFEAEMKKDVVERERLVVLREKAQMDTHDYAQECAALEALHSENVLGTQFPIGSADLIRGWTREQVKGFYKKWFRPPNSTLFIVGDLQGREEEVVSEVEACFGGVDAGVAPVRSPVFHMWSPDAPTIRIDQQSKDTTVGRITLMSKQAVHPLKTWGDMRQYVAEDIAIRAVASRLARSSRTLEVPVVAEADCVDSIREDCRVSSIRIGGTTVDGAMQGVKEAARVVSDVCNKGLDKGEIEALGEDYVKGLEDMKDASSAEQLEMLMDLLLLGHTPVAPGDAVRMAKRVVKGITAGEVMEGAKRVFGGLLDNRLRAYASGKGWTEESIMEAIREGMKAKGERPKGLALHCQHLVQPAASVPRVLDIKKDSGVYHTELGTGVKVRVIQSRGEPGSYRVRIRWPGGALKARSAAHAAVASHVLASQWQRADGSVDAFMKGHSLSEPVMGQSLEWTEISVSGGKEVEAALEFIKYVLTSQVGAGREGSVDIAKAIASLEALGSSRGLSIEREGLDRLVGSMYPHTDILREPKGVGEVREVTKELSWVDDSQLQIDMVGDFRAPQEAFAAADKFFGTMKMMEGNPKDGEARQELPSVADSWTDAPQRVELPKVASDRALVLLGGGMEKQPEWQVALLAEEVLNTALFRRLREESRLTYDARGSFLVPDRRGTGSGHWTVAVHTDPADADQCVSEALQVVRGFKKVDEAALARAKTSVLGQLLQLQQANAFILAMLDKPGGLERISKATTEEVEDVFQSMRTGPRSTHVVVAEGTDRNVST
ncbi:hypothetical protein FOL47_004195 [Perkinsus chesapeaki]|uniref:Peptidase C1A papain C-terminal domain-containing protein n=1 Tax=Perkinsus chesapeaki TaxID=330153 RepID=A0A7J6MZB1_PERCH|nr:hypothetical protein FOL47_004195 [Perkinsus chesapeaki]